MNSSPVAAVLWDIDGTLLSSGGVAARTFLDAVRDVTGVEPVTAGIDFGGRIDPEIAALLLQAIGFDDAHVPLVLARLAKLSQAREQQLREHTRALDGVPGLLAQLAAAEVPQTVVTGNVQSVALLKLAAAELVPPIDPELGGYGDSGASRAEVASVALQKVFGPDWDEHASRSWIIGDTPRDVACAQALGLRCVLVGTGHHPVSSMEGLGADLVLPSLRDLTHLSKLWGDVL